MIAAWFEAVLPFPFFLVMLYGVSLLDLHRDGDSLYFPCKISSRKEGTLSRKGWFWSCSLPPSVSHGL